jgi:hypothetical protein
MKNYLLVFFLLFNTIMNAQVKTEKGYYIDAQGIKHQGEFKNFFFDANNLVYSFTEKGATKNIDLSQVEEFAVGGVKYQKKMFYYDPEAKLDFQQISSSPDYNEQVKTSLVEVLVEGQYSLYRYVEGGVPTFFYSIDGNDLNTLIYKKYLDKNSIIQENNSFVNQLMNQFPDSKFNSKIDFKSIKYRSSDLIDFFTKINGKKYVSEKKIDLRFNLFAGYSIHSMNIDFQTIDYGTQTYNHFTAMPEFEMVFNKYKKNPLSLYVNVKYHKFNKDYIEEFERENLLTLISYEALNFSLGTKKYFLANEKSAFYGKFGIGFNTVLDSEVLAPIYAWNIRFLDLSGQTFGFNVGLGYKFLDKYMVELDYDKGSNTRYYTNNTSVNFKVGYSF